ncbi:AraC family transcriptional regulator [Paenibacillus sp.]|uniref:AraC family transcriptional regulator n=1 Tax=Paenibacillus sp. TaxID=58172 RepID=UPI0028AA98FC|nr:AraC family transcriptional regulator [Paenibacillus sp.]
MNHPPLQHPVRKRVPFQEWTPSIHYAQFQTVTPRLFPGRRLYDFELLYVCHGQLSVAMEERTYTVLPGQLIVLPSGVYHRNATEADPTTKLIGIHFDFFGDLNINREEDMVILEEGVMEGKIAVEAVEESCSPLSEEPVYHPSHDCVQFMEKLVHEFTMRPLGYQLVCRGLMLNILASLIRSQMSRRITGASVHGQKVKEIMQDIEETPATTWSNAILAERLGMSEDYTSKLFRQIVGIPPGEYVRSVRHREARKLLQETDWPIERIGELVGYPDIHYFSRVFTAAERISPRGYRKLSRVL